MDKGESAYQTVVREALEELGVEIDPQDLMPLTFAAHYYAETDFQLLMPLFTCYKWKGTARGMEGQAIAWASEDDLISHKYEMPPADAPLIPHVLRAMRERLE